MFKTEMYKPQQIHRSQLAPLHGIHLSNDLIEREDVFIHIEKLNKCRQRRR